ncbi:MAG: hypothetical protein HYU66_19015, partial [Armatimonadetes bacterium]|nr:hypothetical protein [Armatimonadota bacterium]
PVRAGAVTIPVEEALRLAPDEAERIRPYHPARDWRARARLEDLCPGTRVGALRRRGTPRPEVGGPDQSGRRWVYEQGDSLAGYLQIHLDPGEGTLTGAFDLARPNALAALVRHGLGELLRCRIDRAVGRFPFDPAVEAALVTAGVGYVLHELFTAPAGNMLLLVDLPALVEAAAPEWTRRLAEAGGARDELVLELAAGEQEARVAIGPDGVAPTRAPADARLAAPVREMLLLILGYRGPRELGTTIECPPDVLPTVERFIRRVPTATGPLG